jgi:hypothetical protein
LLLCGRTPALAESYHVIICGSGGGEPFAEQFEDWGQRLRAVLIEQLGKTGENVYLLTESGHDADAVSSVEETEKVFQRVGRNISKADDGFVYLVGHGSFRRNVAKLNVPGEDLTADQLDDWLRRWAARQVVVINTASTSGVFVNVLSGKGRIICTSTSSAEERNATRFMGFFISALEEGSADQNRDERISVLEICRQAGALTDAWYANQGYLATEHPLIDDNGDKKGSRVTDMRSPEMDGKIADQFYLLDVRVPKGTSPALVDAYQAAIASVEALVKNKADLDAKRYLEELEGQLLKAARLNRKIHDGEPQMPD